MFFFKSDTYIEIIDKTDKISVVIDNIGKNKLKSVYKPYIKTQ